MDLREHWFHHEMLEEVLRRKTLGAQKGACCFISDLHQGHSQTFLVAGIWSECKFYTLWYFKIIQCLKKLLVSVYNM